MKHFTLAVLVSMVGVGACVDLDTREGQQQQDLLVGTSNGIYYHGGPLMTGTVSVYYIWYGDWSFNTAPSLLRWFIGDLSGSSYEHINGTYSTNSMQITGALQLANETFDTRYSRGTSLADWDIQSIVAEHCADFGGCNASSVYFVLTSADVAETPGFCTQYCSYHNHASIGGVDVKYAFVGDTDRCPAACQAQDQYGDPKFSPNGNQGADGMASNIARELDRAVSDPDLNAWFDANGRENAAKCAWTFGTVSTAWNGSLYNFSGASGHQWLIQQNWVNAYGGLCAMSWFL